MFPASSFLCTFPEEEKDEAQNHSSDYRHNNNGSSMWCGAQQTVTDRVVQSDMVEETEVQSETVTQTINETESETEQTLETITTAEQENAVIDRSETFALLNDMKAGWNLGNTLDAHASADLTSETSWGNQRQHRR